MKTLRAWECLDSDTGEVLAEAIRKYHPPISPTGRTTTPLKPPSPSLNFVGDDVRSLILKEKLESRHLDSYKTKRTAAVSQGQPQRVNRPRIFGLTGVLRLVPRCGTQPRSVRVPTGTTGN